MKMFEVEVRDIVGDHEVLRYVAAESMGKAVEAVERAFPPPNFEVSYIELKGKVL